MRSAIVQAAVLAAAVLAVVPVLAGAQQPTRRRQAPIVIKGQVPTPQIVTVRPREVPTYSRQVLVPRFYDHDFWPDIQTGYLVVPERQITGRTPFDTASAGAADSAKSDSVRADSAAVPRAMTAPSAPRRLGAPTSPSPSPAAPGAAPRASPAAPADTTRRTPGTPSAPPAR